MKKCEIEGCVNELPDQSEHKHCALCRHSTSYWKKKRPAQVLERRRKLTMYGDRLETFFITPSNNRRSK